MATYWVTTKQFESQFDGNLLATVKYEVGVSVSFVDMDVIVAFVDGMKAC